MSRLPAGTGHAAGLQVTFVLRFVVRPLTDARRFEQELELQVRQFRQVFRTRDDSDTIPITDVARDGDGPEWGMVLRMAPTAVTVLTRLFLVDSESVAVFVRYEEFLSESAS